MGRLTAGDVGVEVDLTITVHEYDLTYPMTLDDAWEALVRAGNDPAHMSRHPDRIVVYSTYADVPDHLDQEHVRG